MDGPFYTWYAHYSLFQFRILDDFYAISIYSIKLHLIVFPTVVGHMDKSNLPLAIQWFSDCKWFTTVMGTIAQRTHEEECRRGEYWVEIIKMTVVTVVSVWIELQYVSVYYIVDGWQKKMNEWMKPMNERTSVRMNEWMNEWKAGWVDA